MSRDSSGYEKADKSDVRGWLRTAWLSHAEFQSRNEITAFLPRGSISIFKARENPVFINAIPIPGRHFHAPTDAWPTDDAKKCGSWPFGQNGLGIDLHPIYTAREEHTRSHPRAPCPEITATLFQIPSKALRTPSFGSRAICKMTWTTSAVLDQRLITKDAIQEENGLDIEPGRAALESYVPMVVPDTPYWCID
ncbi:hypothetical protein BCR34DRAFT_173678 [Clohesyomyces aquaticus]|uniref:Uncharacterized protein n=1 Tax=Clohesyomyces aquaticus TaxID=1231657 RepID=A0A1Y1YGF0_9PLEO|nr:hypothetical protein BCR34DRAFT_173678 [Clohesyomyces aquaticus]